MTQLKRRLLYTLFIWTIALLAFIFVFFIEGGPEDWIINKVKKIVTVVIIGLAYFTYLLMILLTRKHSEEEFFVKDERDILIEMKSNKTAFIITLNYVYLISITIYLIYEKSRILPVSWMWFIAYTSIFVAYIASSFISLILYKRLSGDEE
jgi:hypothetical protein